MLCGDKGLKGQAQNMRRLPYFDLWKFTDSPTEDDLLNRIVPRYINLTKLDVLEKIIDELTEKGLIDGSRVVIKACFYVICFLFFFPPFIPEIICVYFIREHW